MSASFQMLSLFNGLGWQDRVGGTVTQEAII